MIDAFDLTFSPNYPSDYGNLEDQLYYIQVLNGFKVTLNDLRELQINITFDDFNVETNYDVLTLFDGPTVDSPKLAK